MIRGAKEAGAGGADIDAVRVVSGLLQRHGQRAVAARRIENGNLLWKPQRLERTERGPLNDREVRGVHKLS